MPSLIGDRCAVNDVFGFLQAESGEFFHELHDCELAAASGFQDHVKLGLLFTATAFTATSWVQQLQQQQQQVRFRTLP